MDSRDAGPRRPRGFAQDARLCVLWQRGPRGPVRGLGSIATRQRAVKARNWPAPNIVLGRGPRDRLEIALPNIRQVVVVRRVRFRETNLDEQAYPLRPARIDASDIAIDMKAQAIHSECDSVRFG